MLATIDKSLEDAWVRVSSEVGDATGKIREVVISRFIVVLGAAGYVCYCEATERFSSCAKLSFVALLCLVYQSYSWFHEKMIQGEKDIVLTPGGFRLIAATAIPCMLKEFPMSALFVAFLYFSYRLHDHSQENAPKIG